MKQKLIPFPNNTKKYLWAKDRLLEEPIQYYPIYVELDDRLVSSTVNVYLVRKDQLKNIKNIDFNKCKFWTWVLVDAPYEVRKLVSGKRA